jgi:hypothetical protein
MLRIVQIYLKTKQANLLLTALAGAVLGMALVQGLSSERVLGLAFSEWQVALIYFLSIAGSVLYAIRGKQPDKEEKGNAASVEEAVQVRSE